VERRTPRHAVGVEGFLHVLAVTTIYGRHYGLANGGRILWLPLRAGATFPAEQRFSKEFGKTTHWYQAMLNTSDTVRSTQTIDGRILLDVRHGRMFAVNAIGSKILELLEHGQDEPRIADEISRAYGMNIEVVRPDVHDFIEALHKHEIVQSTDAVDSL
jgi:hypothetical protein